MLFHDDKATLHAWMAKLRDFAATRLRLLLHPAKCQVFPTSSGVPFLGFRHFATHRRLKRPNVVRFRRRLRGLQQAYANGGISLDKAGESIQSWCAHAAHGNTYLLGDWMKRVGAQPVAERPRGARYVPPTDANTGNDQV